MVPSELPALYWRVTFNDLRTRMTLKVSETQIGYIQDFQNMATILSSMFGGKGGGGGSAGGQDAPYEPTTVQELKGAVQRLFGGRQ